MRIIFRIIMTSRKETPINIINTICEKKLKDKNSSCPNKSGDEQVVLDAFFFCEQLSLSLKRAYY